MEQEILQRLQALEKFVEALKIKVESLDKLVYDEVLVPLENSFKEYEYNTRLNDWTDKWYDKLNPYVSRLKAIEGDDFDVYRQTMDEFDSMPEEGRMSEDDYINELTQLLDTQIERIRKELGVSDDAKITIEDNGAGAEPVITVEETEEAVEKTEPAEVADANEQETVSENTAPVDEVGAYEKELEEYATKHLKK